jgi:hypothetical protein
LLAGAMAAIVVLAIVIAPTVYLVRGPQVLLLAV